MSKTWPRTKTPHTFEARLAVQEQRVSSRRKRGLTPADACAAATRVRELAPDSPAAHEAYGLDALGFQYRLRRVFHHRVWDPPSPPAEVCEEVAQACWRAVFYVERAVRGALGMAPPPKGPPPLPLPPDWTPVLRPGEREPFFKVKDEFSLSKRP